MTHLTPYICVADARAAIEWYIAALGAEVTYEPIVMDDGRVGHCELAIGEAHWMMSDEFDSAGVAAPTRRAGRRCRCTSRSPTSTRPPRALSRPGHRWRAAPRTVRPPGGWLSSSTRSVTAGS
ncbi:hypothetical protein L0A91_13470 [Ornithinimicrobium sp. INDO-MA30-4]|nr:hypothetical protein [Ornithinimicrobium sp. INDO-MA30-4]UJH70178.1 hypothetical protein L0A91_13470 [Ornithinimicrobium sp. INDO-MA30-4]